MLLWTFQRKLLHIKSPVITPQGIIQNGGKKRNARNARKEKQTIICTFDVCCNEGDTINWRKMKYGGAKKNYIYSL